MLCFIASPKFDMVDNSYQLSKCREISIWNDVLRSVKIYLKSLKVKDESMLNFSVTSVSADGISLVGARASAGREITNCGSLIYTGQALGDLTH